MKATISLKQLRADPREYIRLLNSGFEVTITDHRRELTRTTVAAGTVIPRRGDGQALLEYLRTMPNMKTPYPTESTVNLLKRTRLEQLETKFGKPN